MPLGGSQHFLPFFLPKTHKTPSIYKRNTFKNESEKIQKRAVIVAPVIGYGRTVERTNIPLFFIIFPKTKPLVPRGKYIIYRFRFEQLTVLANKVMSQQCFFFTTWKNGSRAWKKMNFLTWKCVPVREKIFKSARENEIPCVKFSPNLHTWKYDAVYVKKMINSLRENCQPLREKNEKKSVVFYSKEILSMFWAYNYITST